MRKLELSGLRFGRLTVIQMDSIDASGCTMWLCECECGNDRVIRGSRLKQGYVRSCGCLARDTAAELLRGNKYMEKHGQCGTKTWNVWEGMISRCHRESNGNYSPYGGEGIKVCKRWRKGFKFFLEDMGKIPSENYTIDRIDNEKGYSLENCRWATRSVQSFNRRVMKNSSTGVTGVTKARSGRWRASIGVNKTSIWLGTHDSLEDAALIRQKAELKYYGFSPQ